MKTSEHDVWHKAMFAGGTLKNIVTRNQSEAKFNFQ